MSIKDEIIFLSGGRIRDVLDCISASEFEEFEEIRFRVGKPSFVKKRGNEYFLLSSGAISLHQDSAFVAEAGDIKTFINILSGYSLYAFEEELKNGYITVEGGHRIGVSGKTVVENGNVMSLNSFSGINIRISHEIKGCAENVLPYITEGQGVFNTLIVSPPGVGKTTLLRDIIRLLSIKGKNVSVADERGEIAGSWQGKAYNDLGPRADILDCCPKKEGMLMLLRSMSPDVIAVDELGSDEEIKAVETILSGGVSVICTVHGNRARFVHDIHGKGIIRGHGAAAVQKALTGLLSFAAKEMEK